MNERPKIGSTIIVNHENRGAVEMIVIDTFSNFLECEFEGVEICVRLSRIFDGEQWQPRWESIN